MPDIKTWDDVFNKYGPGLSHEQMRSIKEKYGLNTFPGKIPQSNKPCDPHVPLFYGPKHALRWLSSNYQIDIWNSQDKHLEVVLESGHVLTYVTPTCQRYRVNVSTILRMKLRHSVMRRISRSIQHDCDTTIIYVGVRKPKVVFPKECHVIEIIMTCDGKKAKDLSSIDPLAVRERVKNAIRRSIDKKVWNETIVQEERTISRIISLAEEYYRLKVGYDEKLDEETIEDSSQFE